ncbi:hypothetical protein ACFWIB_28425 [Streptomyces sp. NPDC127051]|uniref:hypothetical protein n=1 Tax=Streptomyces sp. NPDC127051 TaxID=3347119 RepID=UPI00364A1738
MAVAACAASVVFLAYLLGAFTDRSAESDVAAKPAAVRPTYPQVAPASPQAGIEKGTLGEDSRCSAPFQGPAAVTWRVCTRVEADKISFAIKLTNQGATRSTVKVRLEYARASEPFHSCPGAPGTQSIDVPAGKTVLTDADQCATPRLPTPYAYQGVGWVVAPEATDSSYQLSPSAHVYPGRPVIWKPEVIG